MALTSTNKSIVLDASTPHYVTERMQRMLSMLEDGSVLACRPSVETTIGGFSLPKNVCPFLLRAHPVKRFERSSW